MLKKVEAKCKRCEKEFCKKRTEQEFCQLNVGTRRGKKPRKTPKGTPGEALLMALFLQQIQ
jgi:hypothetical protein